MPDDKHSMDGDVNENVQPPFKRQRVLESEVTEEELLLRREENDLKLKSRFESIFEKYGKNFEGIGDEIDLETGEIVVDNGHVVGMTNEQDAGDLDDISDEQESDEWSDEDSILTSTLLSQFQQRLKALDSSSVIEPSDRTNQSHERSEDEDSLLGDVESSDKPQENSMEAASPHCPHITTRLLGKENAQAGGGGNKTQTFLNDENDHPSLTPRRKVNLHRMPLEPIWRSPLLPKNGNLSVRKEHMPLMHTKIPSALLKAPNDLSSGRRASGEKPEEMGDPNAARTFWSYSYFPKGTNSKGHEKADPFQEDGSQVVQPQEDRSQEVEPRRNSRPKRIKQTRIHWTDEENALLSRLKLELGLSYDEAAKYFPDRPKKSVVRHWIRLVKKIRNPLPPKPKVTTRIRWTPAENAHLRRLMADPNLNHDDVAGHFPDRPKSSTMRHWTRLMEKDERENDNQMEDSHMTSFSDVEPQSPSSDEADSDSSDVRDASSLPAQTSGRPLSPYRSDLSFYPYPTSVSIGKSLAHAISDTFPSRIESPLAAPKEPPSQTFRLKHTTGDLRTTSTRLAGQGESDQDLYSHRQSHNGQEFDHQAALPVPETRHGEDGQGRPHKYVDANRNSQAEVNEFLYPDAGSEHRPNSSTMTIRKSREPLPNPVRVPGQHVISSKYDKPRRSYTKQLDLSDDELSAPVTVNNKLIGKTQEKRKSPPKELMIDPKLLAGTV